MSYASKQIELETVYDGNLFINRIEVPGGWIYNSYDKQHSILGSSFVPFPRDENPMSRSDTEMLEWINKTKSSLRASVIGMGWFIDPLKSNDSLDLEYFKTPREAIRAAMKENKNG